jgi:hypothetical protein
LRPLRDSLQKDSDVLVHQLTLLARSHEFIHVTKPTKAVMR